MIDDIINNYNEKIIYVEKKVYNICIHTHICN